MLPDSFCSPILDSPGKRNPLATCQRQRAECPRSLRTAFEKESIQQQQNHRADNRHDPASYVILPREELTDPRADQRTRDAEQNRDDATAGVSSRHQQFRDRTDDKTNKNGPNP
jgi:hypothetical protein